MGKGQSKPQAVIKIDKDNPSYDFEAFQKLLNKGPGNDNTKVFVVCISGVYRSGKLFLLNLMKTYLDYYTTNGTDEGWESAGEIKIAGGHWAGGEDSVTLGIWMYMYPELLNGRAFLLMDCQGTADLDRSSETIDNLILFLGLQLSDVHILNVNQTMGSDAISRLSLCSLHADDEATTCIFKRNIVLVRNWRNSHRPRQLDDIIQATRSDSIRKQAEGIKKAFKFFDVEGLSFPGACIDRASECSKITIGDVAPEFLAQATKFFNKLTMELSSEAVCTRKKLLQQFRFLSKRSVGKIATQRQAYEESLIQAVFKETSQFFEARVEEFQSEEPEIKTFSEIEKKVLEIYNESLRHFDGNPKVQKCEGEEIKAYYGDLLEKGSKDVKERLKCELKVRKANEEVEKLRSEAGEANRKWEESLKKSRRASEEEKKAREEMQHALKEYERETDFDKKKLLEEELERKTRIYDAAQKKAELAKELAEKDARDKEVALQAGEQALQEQKKIIEEAEQKLKNSSLGDASAIWPDTVGGYVGKGVGKVGQYVGIVFCKLLDEIF